MRPTNRKLALSIFGLVLASGFALTSCESPTLPRFPSEQEEENDTTETDDEGIRVGMTGVIFQLPGAA